MGFLVNLRVFKIMICCIIRDCVSLLYLVLYVLSEAVFPALQGGPHNATIGALAFQLKQAADGQRGRLLMLLL